MALKDLSDKIVNLNIQLQIRLKTKNNTELFSSKRIVNEELNIKAYVKSYRAMKRLNSNNIVYLELTDDNKKQKIKEVRFVKEIPIHEELTIEYYDSEFQLYGFTVFDQISMKLLEKRYLVPDSEINDVVYSPSKSIDEFFIQEEDNNAKILQENLKHTNVHFMTSSSLGVFPGKEDLTIIEENKDVIVNFCKKYNLIFVFSEKNQKMKKHYKNQTSEIGFIKYKAYKEWVDNSILEEETESFLKYINTTYQDFVLKPTIPNNII